MKLDEDKILKLTYGDKILNFYNIIINNFSAYDLDDFIYNLNTLKVVVLPDNLDAYPFYDSRKNKLYIPRKGLKDEYIYHELFRMLSTYHLKDAIYSGFATINKKNNESIGKGLNEGYTQVLVDHYFKDNEDTNNYYAVEKHIASHLESIIEPKTMERYYMNSDLEDLVYDLNRFSETKEDVTNFINNIDSISEDISNNIDINSISNKINDVLRFLLNEYIVKQTMLYHRLLIDDNTFKTNIENYLKSISSPILYKDSTYQVMSINDVENILGTNSLEVEKTR